MGHWYTKDGEPRHFTPKANGGGMRNTTLADARKLGLLPGVTEILNVLAKPGLERWKTQQAIMAVVTAPDVPGEGLDAKIERVLYTENQAGEESAKARDRGTELHAALDNLFQGREIPAELEPWVLPAYKHIKSMGGTIKATEQVLVGDGYAGRCDMILGFMLPHEHDVVVDFKTAKTLPTKGSWDEHRMQLAAYARAWHKDHGHTLVDTANLYISTVEPGKFAWFDNGDLNEDYFAFISCVRLWQHFNNYKP